MNENIVGMLSDKDIKQYFGNQIKIFTENRYGEYSFNIDKQLQLASIDLRFRHECKRFKQDMSSNLNYEMLKAHAYTEPFELSNDELLVIQPGEIIFTTTLETICISNEFAGIITGRSSFARMGIMVHCCQEFINPGQGAPVALQIVNLGKYPVELDMRIPICQLVLFRLGTPASELYSQKESSKYKGETDFISSRIYEEAPDDREGKRTGKKKKLPTLFRRIVADFMPSIIMLLLIEPTLSETQNITLQVLFEKLFQAPVSLLLVIVSVVLFCLFGKENK